MNNDYLRLENEERLSDQEVNKYSVKKVAKKKKSVEENSMIKLIFDEIYSKNNVFSVSQTKTNKPKLLDAIVFSSILILFGFILAVITYTLREFFLLELFVLYSSLIVPLSLIYFFYRLDVKGNVKFSTLMYCVLVGISLFIATELIFNKFISEAVENYHSNVAIRCLFELLTVSLACYFISGGMQKKLPTTSLLVACAVAVGFVFSNSLSVNFKALLINVSVSPNGETVGAILNIENYVKTSAKNVISIFTTVSVYRSFLFIALTVIVVKILSAQDGKVGKKTANIFFTFLFCCVTYILSSLKTPFNVLTFFYNLISIVFTCYLFINAINSCVKSEKYE